MSWSDVLGKFFDFLRDPSSRGVMALTVVLAAFIYVMPIFVMAWGQIQSTDRIVSAIEELKYTFRYPEKIALKER